MTAQLILRIGIFLTFLGHGMAALRVEPGWVPFLTTVGVPLGSASLAMRVIGSLDIVVAAIILVKPIRMVICWAICWAFLTAAMRPIAGGSFIAFIERGANWAAPLALFYLRGFPKTATDWFK